MKTTTAFLFVSGLVAMASFGTVACSDETGGSTSTTTSSSSGAASSSGSSSSSSGMAMPELTCDYYCKSVDDTGGACGGSNDQYADNFAGVCMKICAGWPQGMLSDTTGNSLGCRIYHGGVAATDEASATTHCPHAGPFGEGQCGDPCDNFCALAMATCTGGNAAFQDMQTCMTECGMFPKTMPAEQYSVTNSAGNSFGCRAYHLTAAVDNPAMHCSHINMASAPCK